MTSPAATPVTPGVTRRPSTRRRPVPVPSLLPEPVDAALDASPAADPSRHPDRFLDRELSWLAFNERVLELADDPELPLLERARFLAIFASNLDEFFMVRVAGLKRRIATGLAVPAASGLEPREVLEAIGRQAHALQSLHAEVYRTEVAPALAEFGHPAWRTGTSSPPRSRSACTGSSATRSSRCSPRSRSIPRTPSPTSRGCRSTSR